MFRVRIRDHRQHVEPTIGGRIVRPEIPHSPWPGSAPIAMVNGALESFVRAAAIDRRGKQRINVVSPPLITETARKRGMKRRGVPVSEVAKLYMQAIRGDMTGQILSITLT